MAEFLRRLGIIGVLMAALLATGCSTLGAARLAYNQAPDLTYWMLDGYADFNGTQSLQAKAALARWHDWHRQTELPRYAKLLQAIRQQMQSDISTDQACMAAADARQAAVAAITQVEPDAASLAATLTPAQLDTMARKFAKGNAEWQADYLSAPMQKVQAKRMDQAKDRAEMLYGRLNEAQSESLRRAYSRSVFDPAVAYAERLRRQDDALKSLRAVAANPSTATVSVNVLIARTLASPNAPYRRYQEALTREGCAVFSDLHREASTAQRVRAAETLQRYEALLLSLSTPP